ncbi:MAG: helix-turn-helix transcriptional regulator [Cyclobacteriaceae bacterium]|jgi:DNA-binding CsgD family transcriptional regulator|nr:helix-turn-helix transcriptional regulator [Cytophagales bacterium]MCZ8327058.1 helix-turn-helix transcriptional regulator [Cyclobacteriaceae bacterium]
MTTLSQLEIELLKHICSGKSSSQIGDIMFKSPRTIEDYREKLYRKFGVNKKEELIYQAIKQQIV